MLKNLSRSQNFDTWFAVIPARMYLDERLNGTDRDVYGAICICLRSRSGSIEVAQQEIGAFLNLSARQVRRSIRALLASGALKTRKQRGGPSVYEIAARPKAKRPSAERAAPEKVKCPKCRKFCRGLLMVGWCRSCNWKAKVRMIVREEVQRGTPRKAA
jgi:hypothetical protein